MLAILSSSWRTLSTYIIPAPPTPPAGDRSPSPSFVMVPSPSTGPSPTPSHKPTASKLFKRRKSSRPRSLQFPHQLALGEDAEDDVTSAPTANDAAAAVPPGRPGSAGAHAHPNFLHLNQSVFSLIAAAGSATDFHNPVHDADSASSSDAEAEEASRASSKRSDEERKGRSTTRRGGGTIEDQRAAEAARREWKAEAAKQTWHGAADEAKSLGAKALKTSTSESRRGRDWMSQSVILPPRRAGDAGPGSPRPLTPRDAPVMSRILEARAQLEDDHIAEEAEEADEAAVSPKTKKEPGEGKAQVSLKMRLKEIFGFETAEDVLSEYPCWLLQSVLLQGYMYITQGHVCFYAYLPKRSSVVAKSGYLSKKGKQSPKYSRYWFTLKGDVVSYYTDPSNLYFPAGNIDLRYGVSACLVDAKEKAKESSHFTVTTHHRVYYLKADSHASAKEWVRILQKVIFRTHNDGDSVKISLPTENIIDVEESPVIGFADTFKIRVVDSEETYAIDEYFFSFFSFGKDALDVLRALVESNGAPRFSVEHHDDDEAEPLPARNSPVVASPSPMGTSTPVLRESVKATLSPTMPPVTGRNSSRASGEWKRPSMEAGRRSVDVSRDPSRMSLDRRKMDEPARRSFSTGRMHSRANAEPLSPGLHGSSDSYVHSMEPSAASSGLNLSMDTASASQILSRSDVFQSPTIQRAPHSAIDAPEHGLSARLSRLETIQSRNEDGPPPRLTRMHSDSEAVAAQQGAVKPPPTMYPSEHDDPDAYRTSASPSLQQLVKGSFPLQKAAGFAGYLRRGSKRMSALLATESMGYVEKVSGMWAGGRKHYAEGHETPDEGAPDDVADENADGHGDRFRAHFALPAQEKLRATYFGYLHRVLPLYGKIYVGDRHLCFRSLLPGTKTRLILPLAHIENVTKERAVTALRYAGLVVVIQAHEELFFEFNATDARDDCCVTLLQSLESVRFLRESGLLSPEDRDRAAAAQAEHRMLQQARAAGDAAHEVRLPTSVPADAQQQQPQQTPPPARAAEPPPILFDDPRASILNFKPTESLRITCLTIGSRGDVQPYIALCKGLLAEGHQPRIATHREFEGWIRGYGIDFAPVEGDPAELMRICVENGMFTYSFLKEASSKFRGWIDELLSSAWAACARSDILIESPSAMAGIHIAEALEIPYFRAFTMPWTRTRAYPHAFAVPERKMGGAYNYVTYVMFDNVFWAAIAGQVNRWRRRELGLPATTLDKLHPNKVPFLYNFSPAVVVPPLDYSDWIRVTGYWFLDEGRAWQPPPELAAFIARARADGKKLVYIGFGSIVVSDPAALTRTIVDAVRKADVRCILSKGWSDRLGSKDRGTPELPLPPDLLHPIASAPHDWLFRQIDAAAHHGGAGTTGASLRAGVPTLIKPFFGDQFFFGGRVEDLGVGLLLKKLNTSVLARALWEATHSERMIVKARVLGEQIRKV